MPLVVDADTETSYGGLCEPWPVTWPCVVPLESATVTGQALQAASEILHALSGRQFGLCELTLRPCRDDCLGGPYEPWPGLSWPRPALVAGRWYNLACGICAGSCSCTALSEVLLPAPVHEVTEVKVDGETLDPSAYRLDDARRLVRLGEPWPSCQDFNLADTQPGTWSVTAVYGQPVPTLGQLAVGELACSLLPILQGEGGTCPLPANLTQLVRQGVTIQLNDPNDALTNGQLGLRTADLFLRAVNPAGLPARSRVYSVDRAPARRVGT